MKISYKWLRNYIDTELSIDEISSVLTDIGLEVDGIEKSESIRGGLAGVVVGHVLTCTDHPDSDHLHITSVDVGGSDPLPIVCGAANVAAGQKVLVATVGAVLYPTGAEDGFKIKKSKIRGVESLGMICAEDELGIGTGHEGIMVLDEAARPGTPAAEYLGLEEDYAIEIGLTPNRADAISHYGVARDLAAWLRTHDRPVRLKFPEAPAIETGGRKPFDVTVENGSAAPRYAGVLIEGIRVAPSPDWLQTALRSIGLNPKNNVVDITNFVLHELGQPLHAFDAARIEGGRIVVRNCPEGTPLRTLDGVDRKLSAEDLVICNAEAPMCIAGVMGGEKSGVSDSTTAVFIESAYFNPVSIRKSARRHGISSDASFRYERGIDPNITIRALRRAVSLVLELAGGHVTSGVTDIVSVPEVLEPFRFDVSLDRIDALVGQAIPEEQVRRILQALEISVEHDGGRNLSVAVPPYRVDVRREADLAEEILRLYGYNNIAIPQRVTASIDDEHRPTRRQYVGTVSDHLTSRGFNEIMSNSLTRAAYYEGLRSYPAERCVRILNPLSTDLNVMRQTLLFNALEAVALNTNHRNPNLRLYEFGNVYSYDDARACEGGLAPYSENFHLAVTMTGQNAAATWNVKPQPLTFFDLRAVAENLLQRFGLDIYKLRCEPADSDLLDEGIAIGMNGKTLLTMGTVGTAQRRKFDIKADVYYMEMDFDLLMKTTRKNKTAAADLPRFPEVRRDLALLVNRGVTFAQLRAIAFSTEKKLLRNVTLFDVYEGDKLPEGKKSYALGFVLQNTECTLTDKIIDKIMASLTSQFERQAGATVRQ